MMNAAKANPERERDHASRSHVAKAPAGAFLTPGGAPVLSVFRRDFYANYARRFNATAASSVLPLPTKQGQAPDCHRLVRS